MKAKNKIVTAVILMLFYADFTRAAIVPCGGQSQDPCTLPILINTVARIINFLLSWAWLVATLFLLWSAWGMVTAGGNSEKINEAKSTLSNAIIGFFLVMTAFLLLNLIVSLVSGSGMPRTGALFDAFDLLPR
ncbi:MAG: hypothetical protein HY336_01580 [Candidatus Doudnabacteria bacterium]|nr:hypothetical protein [Candidatus Doudnabacteria bacterium]